MARVKQSIGKKSGDNEVMMPLMGVMDAMDEKDKTDLRRISGISASSPPEKEDALNTGSNYRGKEYKSAHSAAGKYCAFGQCSNPVAVVDGISCQ